jgi:hypothetical protein
VVNPERFFECFSEVDLSLWIRLWALKNRKIDARSHGQISGEKNSTSGPDYVGKKIFRRRLRAPFQVIECALHSAPE